LNVGRRRCARLIGTASNRLINTKVRARISFCMIYSFAVWVAELKSRRHSVPGDGFSRCEIHFEAFSMDQKVQSIF
jgi:hypothetical protein